MSKGHDLIKIQLNTVSRTTLAIYSTVLGFVSLHFAFAYSNELPFFEGSTYQDIAAGSLTGPDQTRILMPLVFKMALHWRLLADISHRLRAPFNEPLSLLMFGIQAVCIFVATYLVYRAARSLAVPAQIACWGSFLLPLMAYFNYVLTPELRFKCSFDVQQMAVFSICLWAILLRNRPVFYAVFLLGTVNRESTIFLIPMFGLLEWRRLQEEGAAYGRLIAELILQCALWLPLRYFTSHFFVKHPMYMSTHQWRENFHFLTNPIHWPTLFSLFAFLWILYAFQFKRIRHRGLRSCGVLLLPWFVLMVIVGDLLELRIFGEWTAYFAICVLLIVTDLLGLSREDGEVGVTEKA
jgi:hypothetical protein